MTVTATEFKAKCLALMEKVKKTHEPVLITKRGEVIAQLGPPPADSDKPWLALRGSAKIKGDIVGPAMSDKEVTKWIKREAKHIRGIFRARLPRRYPGDRWNLSEREQAMLAAPLCRAVKRGHSRRVGTATQCRRYRARGNGDTAPSLQEER